MVDGFDMTGKSALISKVKKYYPYDVTYKVDYDNEYHDINKVTESYLIGKSQISLLKQISDIKDKTPKMLSVLYDRGYPSSVVYSRLLDNDLEDSMKEYRGILKSIPEVNMYYLSHSSKKSAKLIYESCKDTKEHSDKLDKFDTFEMYWDSYKIFDKEYLNVYHELVDYQNININHFVSEAHSDGDYVTLKLVGGMK